VLVVKEEDVDDGLLEEDMGEGATRLFSGRIPVDAEAEVAWASCAFCRLFISWLATAKSLSKLESKVALCHFFVPEHVLPPAVPVIVVVGAVQTGAADETKP